MSSEEEILEVFIETENDHINNAKQTGGRCAACGGVLEHGECQECGNKVYE